MIIVRLNKQSCVTSSLFSIKTCFTNRTCPYQQYNLKFQQKITDVSFPFVQYSRFSKIAIVQPDTQCDGHCANVWHLAHAKRVQVPFHTDLLQVVSN